MKKIYYLSIKEAQSRTSLTIFLKKGNQYIDNLGVINIKKNNFFIFINESRLNFWIKTGLINFSVSFPDLIILKYLNCKVQFFKITNHIIPAIK